MPNFLMNFGNKSELVSGSHVFCLYSNEENSLSLLKSLVVSGMPGKERCFVFGSKALNDKIDVSVESSFSDKFHLISMNELDEFFAYLEKSVCSVDGDSFVKIRFIIDTVFLFDLQKGLDILFEYEKQVVSFLKKYSHKCVIVDCYDGHFISSLNILRLVNYYDGFLCEGFNYPLYFTNLSEVALKDPLTGLYTERYLQERVKEELFRAKRYRGSCSFISIKISDATLFKSKYGDESLNKFFMDYSDILRSNLRKVDLISMYKSDSFGILMPETSKQRALSIAERLLTVLAEYIEKSEVFSNDNSISLKFGISNFPLDTGEAEEITILADEAVCEAMEEEGHKICVARRSNDSPI